MEVMRYLFKENGHPQEWRTALARVKWAGRMEEILPKVYVDGAHNVSAIQAFARSVPKNPDGNIILFNISNSTLLVLAFLSSSRVYSKK